MSVVNKKELLKWLDEVLPKENIQLDVHIHESTNIIHNSASAFPEGKITHKYETITLIMDNMGLNELSLKKVINLKCKCKNCKKEIEFEDGISYYKIDSKNPITFDYCKYCIDNLKKC